jgi:hypothetical protein
MPICVLDPSHVPSNLRRENLMNKTIILDKIVFFKIDNNNCLNFLILELFFNLQYMRQIPNKNKSISFFKILKLYFLNRNTLVLKFILCNLIKYLIN